MGGKRRLADRLIPLFPAHECYVELFAGGAALFFLKPGIAKCEVLNDINGELVNLYRVVQHHLEEFVRQFKWAISSRQVFKWHQEQPTEPLTDIQRAARFFYLQQHAFGGRIEARPSAPPPLPRRSTSAASKRTSAQPTCGSPGLARVHHPLRSPPHLLLRRSALLGYRGLWRELWMGAI